MSDQLERLIQATEGQAPSSDFVARLRAQIVAETEGSGARAGQGRVQAEASAPNSVIDVVHLYDDLTGSPEIKPPPNANNKLPTRRSRHYHGTTRLVAAAAVAVAVIGAWTLIPKSEVVHETPLELDTASGPSQIGSDEDDFELLTAATTFEAGRYRIDTLGTAFTFTVDAITGLRLNSHGVVSISHLTSEGDDDRTITLSRIDHLPDPDDPAIWVEPSEGWPATDLRGWAEALDDSLAASDPVETTLGGVDAMYIELGDPSCTTADCPRDHRDEQLTAGTARHPTFSAGSGYRLWVADQGDEDPIIVIVAIDEADETSWFDTADAILSTLEFGSIQPNPVRSAAAGPAEIDVFGGIMLDLPQEVVIVEPFTGFARIDPPDIGSHVEFLTRPLDTEGAEVTTTNRLLQLLMDEAVDLTELDSADVGGLEARSFQAVSGAFPSVVLKTRVADLSRPESGWRSPGHGYLWVIEHPSQGLLLVSAPADHSGQTAEETRMWIEDLLGSVEFREP